MAHPTHTRTISWQDPVASAAAGRELSGLDYLKAMASGALPRPPIGILMDFTLSAIEKGKVTFEVEPAEFHYNPIGMVHGGLAATLCDSALGCAVQTMLPAGTGYTTVDLNLTFLRPLTRETGKVRAIAEVIHAGGRIATAQARLVDAGDKLYATATTTCLILRGPDKR
ncbi:MAG: hotdog fold thioesterase [Myxococcales bacterium]